MTTDHFLAEWTEARTRFEKLLDNMEAADLPKKAAPIPNSVGFLLRHIADVELLFAKKVFGQLGVKVVAKTVITPKDTGEYTDLPALKDYADEAKAALHQAIRQQSDSDWSAPITTKEFGTKTKAEALGRILSHTAYHAGQMALLRKYGS